MRNELAHGDLVHCAQRVDNGIENDLRQAGATEVLRDLRVEAGFVELRDRLLLDVGDLFGHCADVHRAGVELADEIDVTRSVEDGRQLRCRSKCGSFGKYLRIFSKWPQPFSAGKAA